MRCCRFAHIATASTNIGRVIFNPSSKLQMEIDSIRFDADANWTTINVYIFFLWQSLIDLKIPWRRYLSNGWMSMQSELTQLPQIIIKHKINVVKALGRTFVANAIWLVCACLFHFIGKGSLSELCKIWTSLVVCVYRRDVFWQTTFGDIFPFSSTTTALERC